MFAVERIAELTPTDETFIKNEDVMAEIQTKKDRAFRVTDDGKPVHVKLKFTPAVVFYVKERTWHPGQKLTEHKDGSVTLEFTATGELEINRWIWSWGEEVEVVGINKCEKG